MNRHPIRWLIQSALVYFFLLGGIFCIAYALFYALQVLGGLLP
jgi:hypothetical protein